MIATPLVALLSWVLVTPLQSSVGEWSDPVNPDGNGPHGTSMAAAGPDELYVVAGGQERAFYRVNGGLDTWTRLAPVPEPTYRGCRLVHFPGSGFLYLVPMEGSSSFYRYSTSGDAWTRVADLPAPLPETTTLAATAERIYLMTVPRNVVPTQARFQEYSPAGDAWTDLPAPPLQPGLTPSLAYPGSGSDLYFLPGFRSTLLLKYEIAARRWISSADSPALVAPLPVLPWNLALLGRGRDGTLFFIHDSSSSFTDVRAAGEAFTYDIATLRWTAVPGGTPGQLRYSSATIVTPQGGETAYLWTGRTGSEIWTYSFAEGRFRSGLGLAPLPLYDVSLEPDGASKLYAIDGSASKLYCYSIPDDAWTELAPPPFRSYLSTSMAYVAGSLYVSSKANAPFLFRYSVADDSWEQLPTPAEITTVLTAVRAVGSDLYLPVRNTASLYRYSTVTGTWQRAADLPFSLFGHDAALAHPGGGDGIFAIPGYVSSAEPFDHTQRFWSYSISRDEWTPLPALPGNLMRPVAGGSSILAFDTHDRKLWSYEISSGLWTRAPDAPGGFGYGCLAASGTDPYLYAMPGGFSRLLWRLRISNAAPAFPASLGQFRLDGITALPPGGITREVGVTVVATVSDPDSDPVHLEAEVRLREEPFSGIATAFGDQVSSGSRATVVVTGLESGHQYKWSVRSVDASGAASDWISVVHDPDMELDYDFWLKGYRAPAAPANPTQHRSLAIDRPLIPAGGVIPDRSIGFEATVVDPDLDAVKLEVEVRPAGSAFTGTPNVFQLYPTVGSSLNRAWAFAQSLPPGRAYIWQVRAIDETGLRSPWVRFGPPSLVYAFLVDRPPLVLGAQQSRYSSGLQIPVGGGSPTGDLAFKALVGDVDWDAIRLEVEWKPLGQALEGRASASTSLLPSGSTAVVRYNGPAGPIHWACRAVDSHGVAGPWMSFGGNPETAVDVQLTAIPPPAPSPTASPSPSPTP